MCDSKCQKNKEKKIKQMARFSDSQHQQHVVRGAFIVFEGGDACGKTTQCTNLVNRLNHDGIRAENWAFPNRSTAIGKIIDDYLKRKVDIDDHAIHLLFSANRWEIMQEFERKLSLGITLVVDRYAYSGIAFSVAKGLNMDWCKSMEKGLLRPDRVYFIDVDAANVASRTKRFGSERYETVSFQDQTRKIFKRLSDSTWKTIDGGQSADKIHEQVYNDAKDLILKVGKSRSQIQDLR